MAFVAKVDYFDLAGSGLVCTSSNDGASASTAEAAGEDGSIVANEVFGLTKAPSCDYAMTGAWEPDDLKLGAITTIGSGASAESFVLSSITITTSGGAATTVSASGEKVEAGATTTCTYSVPSFALAVSHHAKKLWDAWALSGMGCHLQSATYTISATISKGEKDGETLSHDVNGGRIEAAVTILQTGTTQPTLTAGNGWTITSPLACSNPDSNWPTWTATLTKFLAVDA